MAAAPEAFHDDRVLNHWGGCWQRDGRPAPVFSPLDGTAIAGPPRWTGPARARPWRARSRSTGSGGTCPSAERKARVAAAVEAMAAHRDLLALLLVWEIGKPWRLACADVDRCLDGVRWYRREIDRMVEGRTPLPGPVSNIASWNYPMSVLMHAMLVQALAGNAVIAKTPTDGGLACLTLATALAVREGLPFTLVSGGGAELSPVLVAGRALGCVSFVGGRDAARTSRPRWPTWSAARPGAGGAERVGGLGILRLARARPADPELLRLRQAALHRLSAVRGAAVAVPRVPRGLSGGGRVVALRASAGGRAARRSAA